jgi:flagellar biosynthesis component FlhA
MAEKLQRSLIEAAQRQEMQGQPVILLVAGPVRAMLSRLAAWQCRICTCWLTRKFLTTSK